MAENSSGGKGLYLIVGGLVVAVAVLLFFMFGPGADEPDLSIDIGDSKIEVDTD